MCNYILASSNSYYLLFVHRLNTLSAAIHIAYHFELMEIHLSSFDEIYNRRCLNWYVKLENMPVTESENRIPRKLIGAWCYKCSRLRGGQ